MRYEVFHFEGEDRALWFSEDAFTRWPSADYVKVAEVEAQNLHEAYRLTNTIDWGWWENPEVQMTDGFRTGARSLSVGDILRETEGHGRVFGVAMVGFTEVRR